MEWSIREVGEKRETMLGLARLTYDELLTALVEVEMVLNSRPLTVVSAEDLEEPLTPPTLDCWLPTEGGSRSIMSRSRRI